MTSQKDVTALITGASAGLGAEFARQLAQKGYNLALTSRRSDRLESLATELIHKYKIQAQVLPADLSVEEGISKVTEWIPNIQPVEILVNNAGYGIRGKFAMDPIEKSVNMLQVHVYAAVRLTHAALPGMLNRQSGSIINVSSMAALFPIRNVMYSSTKVFLVNFSKALQSELWGSGVKVQVLMPGYVHTEFHDTAEFSGYKKSSIPKIFWLEVPAVVAKSLADLEKESVECIPGWQYRTAARLVRLPLTATLATRYVRSLYKNRRK